MRALALVALAGCGGTTGTLSVTLVIAPGSTVLDSARSLKLVLTNPHKVTTAQRNGAGFAVELDLPATSVDGQLIVDAYNASGTLVATGESPLFPLGAIDASVAIYMAAPLSMAAAPVSLDPARSAVAAGALSYGAIFAGGRDANGTASDAISIYNTYDHSLVAGLTMLAPRSAQALGVGDNGAVYLFGGNDASGTATDTLWAFDTNVSPNGAYNDYGEKTGFARAGQLALPLGGDAFLVTGTPAAELTGLDGSLAARTDIASLPAAGASVVASDGTATTIFAGAGGIVRFRGGAFDMIDTADHTGAAVIALPDGRALVACGTGGAFTIDAAAGTVQALAGVPADARTGCALAATSRHVVIAGGTTGTGASGTVDIYDAGTLAHVATAMLVVPRTGAQAVALPNDQVLIASGLDANGAPTATLELFTPDPPE